MPATPIKTKYAYETHDHPGISFNPKTNKLDRSLTNQADLEASDINNIMKKYEKTGVIVDALGIERKPVFGDFTEFKSYHETLASVRRAEGVFMQLPAATRNRFENDPEKLFQFLENPENKAEAIKLGLIELTPEAPPAAPPAPPLAG